MTCWIVGYLRELKELWSNVTGLWINTGINDQKKQVQIIIFFEHWHKLIPVLL